MSASKPAWFYLLTPREQRKQINRWRYYRRYYRRKYGQSWETELAFRWGFV